MRRVLDPRHSVDRHSCALLQRPSALCSATMASDARAPTADLATSQAPSDQAAPTAAPALTAPPSPSPTLPKLEPYRLRTPLQAAYLVRDFIAPADEVRISRLYRELIRQAYMLQRIEALAGSEEIETISSSPRTSSSTTYRSKATPAGWKTIGGSSPRRSMTFGGQVRGDLFDLGA